MKPKLTLEERNAVIWLERQPDVTSVVARKKSGTRHSHAVGFAKVTDADAKGVNIRVYIKGAYREFYVHAPVSSSRSAWMTAMTNGGQPLGQLTQNTDTLSRDIPTAESFSAKVPAPKAIDPNAGKIFDVTPEMAAKWLERNTRNRGLRSDVVMRYATDMREGRWKITGDAIAFDHNGAIVNGQHRLWAVLESGMTIPMLVMFDLDPDVVFVLDDHLKRKLIDIVHITKPGVSISTSHVGAAKTMMVNVWTADRSGVLSRTSRQKQMDFLARHTPAIDFAVRECFHSTKMRSITIAAVFAVIARAYYTQDRDRLKEFGQVLFSGITNSHDDDAAIVLRNWLMRLDTQGVRARSDAIYRKVERALQLFLAGERVRNLIEAKEEIFPLPEETAPKKGKVQLRKQAAAPYRTEVAIAQQAHR